MHSTERIQKMWSYETGDFGLLFIKVHTVYEKKNHVYHVSLHQVRGAILASLLRKEILALRESQGFADKTQCVGVGEANGVLYELYHKNGEYKLYLFDIIKREATSASCICHDNILEFEID